jgi:hypothetical protein
METGAMVAVTTHGGAAADTATVETTVLEAGVAVAELIATPTPEGKYIVHGGGVEEVVADKGYHSNDVVSAMAEMEVRTYIAEPERGARNWDGKQRRSKRCTRTGGALRANTASACSDSGEKRSNATLHISLTPAAWTGCG